MTKTARFVPIIAVIVAVLIACRRLFINELRHPGYLYTQHKGYNLALLIPNYADNGFIRRGLAGTITYVIDGGSNYHTNATIGLFHLLSAVFLAVPMALLLRHLAARGDRTWPWFTLFMVVSPQLFLGWSRDGGRPDMLSIGFVAWSVVAAVRGRFAVAAVFLVIGSLVHETPVIFGAPLLAGLWFIAYRRGATNVAEGVRALLLLGGLLGAVAIAQAASGDDLPSIAVTVHAGMGLPPPTGTVPLAADGGPDPADVAVFLTWGGLVSIRDSLCGVAGDTSLPFVIASTIIVLLLNFRVLSDRSRLMKWMFAVTTLLPTIFISLVAVDYGRWAMFGVANAWLAAVAVRVMGVDSPPLPRREIAIKVGIFVALLAMGPPWIRWPTDATHKTEDAVFGKFGEKAGLTMDQCDPVWQKRLAAPPAD